MFIAKTILLSIMLLMFLSILSGCNSLLPDLALDEKNSPTDSATTTDSDTTTSPGTDTRTDTASTDDTNTVTTGTDSGNISGGTDADTGSSSDSETKTESESETSSDSDSPTDSESGSITEFELLPEGSGCTENADCATGYCGNEICCTAGTCCNDNSYCDDNLACSLTSFTCNETCGRKNADDDSLCTPGYHCDSGNCIENLVGGQCNEHSDCASNQCIDSLCCEHAGQCCATDSDCPELYDGCAMDDSQTCVFSLVTLPSTQQAECWNIANEIVSCDTIAEGFDLYGQNGHYLTESREYAALGDTVTETDPEKNTPRAIWSKSPSAPMNYASAYEYCDMLDIGGSANWRLPTRTELQGLQSYTPEVADGISGEFSIPAGVTQFWSSTPLAGTFSSTHWVVNFSDGTITRLGIDSISPVALCIME